MSAYEYSYKDKAWTKYCPTCQKDFLGTDDETESQVIFVGIFGLARTVNDGLQAVCKPCSRRNRRRRNGVSDDYNEDDLFTKQDGKCALCDIQLHMPYRYSADAQGARVDHCHKSGKVRGLLCHACNILIGMYENLTDRKPDFIAEEIINYIKLGQ